MHEISEGTNYKLVDLEDLTRQWLITLKEDGEVISLREEENYENSL